MYGLSLALCTTGFAHLVDDSRKAELALVNIIGVLVPLVSILFCTTYWYNTERFTELLLSQPVSRRRLFWSRALALAGALILIGVVGIAIPSLLSGITDSGLVWLLLALSFLSAVFGFFGTAIGVFVSDKMWGIGLALAVWSYFELLHDGILLTVIIAFRDYPLDLVTSLACALNPVSLARVALLMIFDAPLLLGHAGALVRRLVEGQSGLLYSTFAALLWISLPVLLAFRKFSRRDF